MVPTGIQVGMRAWPAAKTLRLPSFQLGTSLEARNPVSYPRGPPSPTSPTPLAPSAGYRWEGEELGPGSTWASRHSLLESHPTGPT